MTHDRWIESAAAYALDALDADERAGFETHLRDCRVCREDVDALREVTARLAHGAAPAGPPDPAALRDRVLRQARDVRPLAAARPRAPRTPWLLAAASVIVAVGLGLLWHLQSLELHGLTHELDAARLELATRDSTLAALLGPEVHVVSLSAGDAKPAARVFWNHTRNLFLVTASDLPPAPPGRTYQLWAIAQGRPPQSMGTFDTDSTGRVAAVLPVSAEIVAAGFIDLCGLTLEPAGGSPQPTETPRLLGPWRHVD